jgi:bacteriocin biosynthesis cyclodehydratase domain-containing protein
MVLKLDGRHAIVWRDPFSLQFGVDPARVVLRDVTTAQERMIAALASGVSRSGLEMIAGSTDASEQDVASLLRTLKPLLRSDAEAAPAGHSAASGRPASALAASGRAASRRPASGLAASVSAARVSLVGRGQTLERIAAILALADVAVTVSSSVSDEPTDLGIVVGHYVLDPESYGFWLRRDTPHLPVVFGDESVLIGPMVEPGYTPCLYCLEHYRRDEDASWSAIASQLWGRRASSETALVSSEVAARVARLVLARLDSGRRSGRSLAARSFRLSVESGEVLRRDWSPHPDCGCVALPGADSLSGGRRETGSAPDLDRPTTVEASAAHG